MRVVFVPSGPKNEVPSSKARVFQFLDYLQEQGISSNVVLCSNYWSRIHRYLSLVRQLSHFLPGADGVFVQKQVRILWVWRVIKLLGKPIVYDFDDAMWAPPSWDTKQDMTRVRKKLARMLELSNLVIVGNKFLADYARKYSAKVEIIPLCLDMNLYPAKKWKESGLVTIGWNGRPSNLYYLKSMQEVLRNLGRKYRDRVAVKIMCAEEINFDGIRTIHIPWNERNEISELLSFDIGLVPLTPDDWSRGKSSGKLLQYMACGIPPIGSPIGFNVEAIRDGINGFMAQDLDEWFKKLCLLIENYELRITLGQAARKTVERYYSLETNGPRLAVALKKIKWET